jgi:uncharacterized protein YndB with AHSA1/START domain
MKRNLLLTILLGLLAPNMPAEVADSAANGFTIKTTLNIQAAPDEVYRRFMRVGDWWASDHTYSGNSHNLTLEEKPMGCWCEKLPSGGSVKHMEVLFLMPGKRIVLGGGLGPLQSLGVTGSMTIELSAANGGTKMDFSYAVSGYMPAGLDKLAAPVNGVLAEQLTRLKNYAEHGDPDWKPAQPAAPK